VRAVAGTAIPQPVIAVAVPASLAVQIGGGLA